MKKLYTWNGKSSFEYSGSMKVDDYSSINSEDDSRVNIRIEYGNKTTSKAKLSKLQCELLLKEFKGEEALLGAIRPGEERKSKSLGEWLMKLTGKETSIASYVAAILVHEGYAYYVNEYRSGRACVIKFN